MNDAVKFERSLEHAWRYFELHAQQRMTVFNFFIAISGLVAAGVGLGLQQGGKFIVLASLLGCFLILVSFIFWKLDQRVSVLIKQAESALIYLEGVGVVPEACIFTKEPSCSKGRWFSSVWTYGKCFRWSFAFVAVTGFILAIVPYLFDFSVVVTS